MGYWAGSVVRGQVLLTVTSNVKARAIRLRLIGRAETHWSERHGSGKNARTVHYGEKMDIMKTEVLLWGNPRGVDGEETLPQGDLSFPICFELPSGEHIPSSFHDTHGFVAYRTEVNVDIAWRIDPSAQLPFTLYNIIDCNLPMYLPPYESSRTETIGCCGSEGCTLKASIQRRAFSFNDAIQANIDLSCQAQQLKIKGFEIKLFRGVRVTAHGRSRYTESCVAQSRIDEDLVLYATNSTKKSISLPLTQPLTPTIASFRLIEVKYQVLISALTRHCCTEPSVLIPVVIGTIPFRGQQMVMASAPVQYQQPAPVASAPVEENVWSHQIYVPPPYQEYASNSN